MLCLVLWPVLLLSATAAEDEPSVAAPRAKDDPEYQRALAEELRLNPPGDLSERPMRRFVIHPPQRNDRPITAERVVEMVLRPVEKPDTDVATLLSEGAELLAAGRLDLAERCYKEVLMIDPENLKAKAVLYDYTVMRCLDQTGVPWPEIEPHFKALQKRTAGDIIARKEKAE